MLADAREDLRKRIPASVFIDLVRSGIWSDRNKGAFLLLTLTESGDEALLNELRSNASEALQEMADWKSTGHAQPARTILQRIATRP